ncbi:MAG: hypothetical protein AAGH89_12140 [Verrucomicrobiota bacterium]
MFGNSDFIFGVPDTDPVLPQGWEVVAAPDEFLKARNPEGELFLLNADLTLAFPYRQCPPEGIEGSRLRPGDWYMDERYPVSLTQSQ